MTHDQKVEAAKAAINAVFSDTSVGPEQTVDSLITLRDECTTMIDAVQTDAPEDG